MPRSIHVCAEYLAPWSRSTLRAPATGVEGASPRFPKKLTVFPSISIVPLCGGRSAEVTSAATAAAVTGSSKQFSGLVYSFSKHYTLTTTIHNVGHCS